MKKLMKERKVKSKKQEKISRKENLALQKKPATRQPSFPFTEKELLKNITPFNAHVDLLTGETF